MAEGQADRCRYQRRRVVDPVADEQRRWRTRVLDSFSIPHLHAVEFRSRHASLYRHMNLEAWRQLLATASDIIVSHVEAGFVVYPRPAELENLTTKDERSRWGGAYGVCTEILIADISRHVGRPER